MSLLYEADVLGLAVASAVARHAQDYPPPDPYTLTLVNGVGDRLDALDEHIGNAAEHWRIGRMPLIDRNVLRVGCYELLAAPRCRPPWC